MMEQIRVVLVDDHHVVRQGLRTYLESFSDLEVVGEASSGEEVLRRIELWLPDVVVMDLLMPGGMDGVETIRRIGLCPDGAPAASGCPHHCAVGAGYRRFLLLAHADDDEAGTHLRCRHLRCGGRFQRPSSRV